MELIPIDPCWLVVPLILLFLVGGVLAMGEARWRRFGQGVALGAGVAILLLLLAILTADRPGTGDSKGEAHAPSEPLPTPGSVPWDLSGMAPFPGGYLVVHDLKDRDDEGRLPRVGVWVERSGKPPAYETVDVRWPRSQLVANDLEAACALPGREFEFLVMESGYREWRYGRIFHLELQRVTNGWAAEILGVTQLPKDTDNVEGLACARGDSTDTDKWLLILGERKIPGESQDPQPPEADPASAGAQRAWARLRWGRWRPGQETLTLEAAVDLAVPPEVGALAANGETARNWRGCSDLLLREDGELWVAAAEDPGVDTGPFRSLVYKVGRVAATSQPPVVIDRSEVVWRSAGIKVEALSRAHGDAEGGGVVLGTDDEDYGGIWRPLPASATTRRPPSPGTG